MRFLPLYITSALAASCGDLRIDYTRQGCCGGSDCEVSIPDCASTSNGKVCFDGTDVIVKGLSNILSIPDCTNTTNGKVCSDGEIIVKGLLDALGFESDRLVLKKSIIPDTNAAYDLGSASNKIRYLFKSDN